MNLVGRDANAGWTFLTNHAHVLLAIAGDPDITMRAVAERVGITHRGAQRIVHDLESAGYLTHSKRGRRNHYHVRSSTRLRHPMDRSHRVGELILLLGE